MLNLEIGKTYRNAFSDRYTVLAELPNGNFVAYATDDPHSLNAYKPNGEAVYFSHSNLETEAIAGYDTYNALDQYGKQTVEEVVNAFRMKKITGIKLLRGYFGWGLLEAKNIFEGVADGHLS